MLQFGRGGDAAGDETSGPAIGRGVDSFNSAAAVTPRVTFGVDVVLTLDEMLQFGRGGDAAGDAARSTCGPAGSPCFNSAAAVTPRVTRRTRRTRRAGPCFNSAAAVTPRVTGLP